MRSKILAATIGLALTLAACGESSNDTESAAAEAPVVESQSAADGTTPVDVLAGESSLGSILTGPDGRTLYGFTNDVDAISTCYGTCADAWPPVIVSDDWTAGPGLDFGIFATTVREDGQTQLVAGQWPLYYFAGDAAPGDLTGQGSGNVWFAVDTDGGLIKDVAEDSETSDDTEAAAAADAADAQSTDSESDSDAGEGSSAAADGSAIVTPGSTDLGEVLIDEAGLTLYGFLNDREAGSPSCNDACADAWPPVLLDDDELPDGLDPEVFSVVTRDDGDFQLAAGIWPLYRFAGDAAPGDVNGQGSGDVWFAVDSEGKLVGAPGAAAADSDDSSDDADDSDSEEDGY